MASNNTLFFTESVFPNITNNATEPGSGGSYFIPPNIQIGVTILAVSISIIALIGNILVIYIVFTVNHMRNPTNTLIANMAVADLLMAIDIPYILKFFYVRDKWFGTFMGTVLCKFFLSAQVGSLIASVFSLVAISLDRSFAILFPMKTVMTRNVVRFAIAMVWLGALAFSLPLMVASKTKQFKGTDYLSCAEFWAPMSANTFILVLIIGGYIIPLIIIAFVYSLAGIRLWSRQLPGHRNLVSNKKAQSSSRRATAMLITVVIVFALSWLPFQALEMLRQYNRPLYESLPIELVFIAPWLAFANSAINPIFYVIFSENYRKEFYRILCRGPSRKDRNRKAVIEGVCVQREQPRRSGHYKSTHCLSADVPQNFDSRESGLPANKQRTLDSSERSLAVDTAPTCESSKSRLASNIPLTGESSEQPSSLGLDKPLTQKSPEVSLPVLEIPVIHVCRGNSLTDNKSVTCESLKESLAANLPLTVPKSPVSALTANISPTCDSHQRVLTVEVTPSTESCRCFTVTNMPVDEVCVNMENNKL